MNIFYVDHSPFKSAIALCDKHVVKMIVESAQMLSTAHRLLGNDDDVLYRKTHMNHPSNVWVRESHKNYTWLLEHFGALCDEYTYRYDKIHLTEKKLRKILGELPPNIPITAATPIRMAMPDEFRDDDPIASYRNYYRSKNEVMSMKWKRDNKPDWFDV